MNNGARQRALHVLCTPERYSHSEVHNAIIDLRRNAMRGDERILRPFLDHPDPMVVAATLYTLFEVHDQRVALRPLIDRIASEGDERELDDMDRPIQCMAISALADFGRDVTSADVGRLVDIAENHDTSDTPRKRAWQELASLFGVEWPRNATEEMILRPESEESDRIRDLVRRAIAKPNSD